jgi:hypothetical protein
MLGTFRVLPRLCHPTPFESMYHQGHSNLGLSIPSQLLFDHSQNHKTHTGEALLVHFLSLSSALFLSTLLLGVDLVGENWSWVGLVMTELYFISLWLTILVHRMVAGIGFGL